MRIVITGGAGFLASRLARALLARGSLTDARGESREIRDLVLVDVVPATISDRRVSVVTGDLAEPALIERVVTDDTDSIFHLAAVVSGQAEAEFDIGMRVNLDATRALLERCRKLPRPPKFVFTSSLAVFGGALPDPVPDDAVLYPGHMYSPAPNFDQLMVLLVFRSRALHERLERFPPRSVYRVMHPDFQGYWQFFGRIDVGEGFFFHAPVARDTRVWVTSPNAVVANLIVGHEAPATKFAHTRSINVPGILVGVGEMVDALRRIAGDAVADRVKWQLDPAIDRIVQTWPVRFAPVLGPALGMQADSDVESIIRQYVEDERPQG